MIKFGGKEYELSGLMLDFEKAPEKILLCCDMKTPVNIDDIPKEEPFDFELAEKIPLYGKVSIKGLEAKGRLIHSLILKTSGDAVQVGTKQEEVYV